MEIIGRSGVQGAGPFINLVFNCDQSLVVTAHFECHGCPSMIRCGDWVTKWVVGRNIDFLQILEVEDLQRVIGGLPLGKEFCAQMAVEALRDIIARSTQMQA